ncbi:hypothetical protein [Spartinivicinus poritis]|uniref:Uncharacterized protein n=1 Tax=Spartinivicinus poritis TaxID=2994640 RepID=A0ABT5UH82_9GAMM|nr:hypothetical protein [Spartinivicinus sp. A2-2]MDE1465570.1 hypothetical protein [Spartinivicinus sp. A2-2]
MKIIAILLTLLSSNSFACELTEEYQQVRSKVYQEANESYQACVASVRAYFYYKAVAKCTEEVRGKNIAGGCYHFVGYEQTSTAKDSVHCEALKLTKEQIQGYFDSVVKKQNITMC